MTAMVRGESSTVSCPRSAASGASGIPDPPSSSEAQRIDFEVTLLDFVQVFVWHYWGLLAAMIVL